MTIELDLPEIPESPIYSVRWPREWEHGTGERIWHRVAHGGRYSINGRRVSREDWRRYNVLRAEVVFYDPLDTAAGAR